jgi:F0F1-type ATP synthase membrane subunit b/b'
MSGRICSMGLLILLVLATPASAADPAAPPCKDGAATCMPWERDWSNTPLPPGSVVTGQGVIYAPSANPIVNFFYNWQTLIAGALAIAAAGLASVIAYLAGLLQARATRVAADTQAAATVQSAKEQVEAIQRAAEQQVETANAQLEHLKAQGAEEDRRAQEDLLAALDAEAGRIPMLVQLRRNIASRRHIDGPNKNITQVEAYKIPVSQVLKGERGLPTLVHGKIRLAVIELRASIEQLNAIIDTKGVLMKELQGQELIDMLSKIHDRALGLQGALGEYGGNRRISPRC